MKRIFIVDWSLIPMFILCACSGVGLHMAGHHSVHEVWHNWAVCHCIASLLFLLAATFHIKMHWGWYKGIVKNGIGKKSCITVVLSIIFTIVMLTGIVLLVGVDGANTPIGLWHYKIGLAISLLCIAHTCKRIPILRKSLKA